MDLSYLIKQLENNFLQLILISIYIFITIIIVFGLIIKENRQKIKDNWLEYRYNPLIMPFAGFFGENPVKNFLNYLWNIVKKYTSFLLKPIQFITKIIAKILSDFKRAINGIRKMTKKIRMFFLAFVKNIMNRIWSVIGTMQYFISKLTFTMKRMYGLMATIIYAAYTGMMTFRSIWKGPIGKFGRFFCFSQLTHITMSDLTTKKIEEIQEKTRGR